jgi:hypothetical protein
MDHSRLAYSEIPPDENGVTCAAFLERAIDYGADHGITRIQRLITDTAWAYRHSLRGVCAEHDISRSSSSRTALAEREGRALQPTLQTEWAYRRVFTSNKRTSSRLCALARVLPHSTPPQLTRRTTADQPPVTNVLAGHLAAYVADSRRRRRKILVRWGDESAYHHLR